MVAIVYRLEEAMVVLWSVAKLGYAALSWRVDRSAFVRQTVASLRPSKAFNHLFLML